MSKNFIIHMKVDDNGKIEEVKKHGGNPIDQAPDGAITDAVSVVVAQTNDAALMAGHAIYFYAMGRWWCVGV